MIIVLSDFYLIIRQEIFVAICFYFSFFVFHPRRHHIASSTVFTCVCVCVSVIQCFKALRTDIKTND